MGVTVCAVTFSIMKPSRGCAMGLFVFGGFSAAATLCSDPDAVILTEGSHLAEVTTIRCQTLMAVQRKLNRAALMHPAMLEMASDGLMQASAMLPIQQAGMIQRQSATHRPAPWPRA